MKENTNMKRRTLLRVGGATTAGFLGSTAMITTVTAAAGSFTREYYGDESYLKYIPSGADGDSAVPLLTMLHGCTQSPGQFANETEMNEVAERETFIVIYPDQTIAENATQCWNWFDYENHVRGSGETGLIANITQKAMTEHAIDPHRVYVAGFSAGAAMVPDLLAAYPDVFAAGGIHSGLEYAAAESASGAVTAMAYGGPNPIEQGSDAYQLMDYNGVASRIPTIVFHGTDDTTINPINGNQATTQAVQTNDLVDTTDDGNIDTDPDVVRTRTADVFDYTIYEYHDRNGNTVVEKWLVDGMGHAWSGGSESGEYTAPGGPDASQTLWEFFASHPDAGNTGEFDGFCGTDYNYQHEDAGRAIYEGGYYATGSGDYLGLSSYRTTLKETREGYFELVGNC
jgi:poly(hydroxyalkanoate) depolymerase family esterase